MLFWKRKWKKELDAQVPKLDSKILNCVSENAKENNLSAQKVNKPKIKWIPRIVGVAVALVLCCTALVMTLTPPNETYANAAVVVEINPSIAFTLKDGKVESVKSLNQDADIIVSDGNFINSVKGKGADIATQVFVDAATKYGFINYSDAAVRVSTYGNVDGDKIIDKVEDYLLQSGIPSVVFSRSLDKTAFNELIGVIDSDVINGLKSMPELYLERELIGKTEKEIEELYDSKVLFGNLIDSAKEVIAGFKVKKECFEKINETNEKIKAINGLGYWLPVDIGERYPELIPLKIEMEELLDQYYRLSGVLIDGYEQFIMQGQYYEIKEEHVKTLEELLLAAEQTIETAQLLINYVKDILGEQLDLSNLLERPKTPEEYAKKLKDSYEYLREAKLSVNVLDYTNQREPIDKATNDARKEEVKNQHGTLEDFWHQKNNKKI